MNDLDHCFSSLLHRVFAEGGSTIDLKNAWTQPFLLFQDRHSLLESFSGPSDPTILCVSSIGGSVNNPSHVQITFVLPGACNLQSLESARIVLGMGFSTRQISRLQKHCFFWGGGGFQSFEHHLQGPLKPYCSNTISPVQGTGGTKIITYIKNFSQELNCVMCSVTYT